VLTDAKKDILEALRSVDSIDEDPEFNAASIVF